MFLRVYLVCCLMGWCVLGVGCRTEITPKLEELQFDYVLVPADIRFDSIREVILNSPESLSSDAHTFKANIPLGSREWKNTVDIAGFPSDLQTGLRIRRNNAAPVNGVSGIWLGALGPFAAGDTIQNTAIEIYTGTEPDAPIYSSADSSRTFVRFGKLFITEVDEVEEIIGGKFIAIGQDLMDEQNPEIMLIFNGQFRLTYD